MSHTLWTEKAAARSALAALRYVSVLPRTVRQDFSAEFVNGRGQTVSILNPVVAGGAKVYTETNRNARDAIVFDDLAQTWIDVKITDQVYKGVRLPDDFATFTLSDMERQVIVPMAQSVADGVTAPLLTVMNGVTPPPLTGTTGIAKFTANGSNALDNLILMRKALNAAKVPVTDRYLAVGPDVEAALLSLPQFQKVNEAGTDGMLREATIGRLFGFTIVVDPGITGAVAYHTDAFALVTRPSRAPEGATKSATIAQDGFSLRLIQQYNPLQFEDQLVLDTFVGAKVLDATRAVHVLAA